MVAIVKRLESSCCHACTCTLVANDADLGHCLQVVYNHEDSERLYPRLAENYKARNQDFGPGQHYSYLGEIVFMQQYRSYEFMYCIEYDVRLVGHYGEFLDASMRHAEVTHGHNMQASLHHHGHHAGDTPSGMSLGPADLILYGHLGWGDKWSSTIISLNLTDHWDAFLMVGDSCCIGAM